LAQGFCQNFFFAYNHSSSYLNDIINLKSSQAKPLVKGFGLPKSLFSLKDEPELAEPSQLSSP
jgi:hypothetical protein